MSGARVEARNVGVVRGGRAVLGGVDITLAPGEVVALMGASGAGKSTLLEVLAGLLVPDTGSVAWNGLRPALVLQRAEIALSAATVAEELDLAAHIAGGPGMAPDASRAALDAVGLDAGYLRRDPLALSGGEQRRVAIAAAIAAQPAVLLLDEPSAGLDGAARDALHAAMRRLQAAGVAILIATHDADEAAALASRVVVLAGGGVAADAGIAEVLGAVERAARLGVGVPAAVQLAAELASPADRAPQVVDQEQLLDWVAARAGGGGPRAAVAAQGAGDRATAGHVGVAGPGVAVLEAPARGDMRVRLVAWLVLLVATFAARSLAGVGVVTLLALGSALAGGSTAREVVRSLRPFLLLAAMLVGIQLAIGAHPEVRVYGGHVVESGLAFALRRALQVVAVVVGSLALTARVAPLDLTRGLAWLLAPLRIVGVPVDDIAFTGGVGLASAATLTDELGRIELAWRARGIDPARLPLTRRLRARTLLVVPFLVVVFRRSHAFADALHARGFASGRPRTTWVRPRATTTDLVLLAIACVAFAAARLA